MPADYGYQNNKRIILLKKGEKVPANLENYPEQKYPSKMNIKWRCFRQAKAKEFIASISGTIENTKKFLGWRKITPDRHMEL